MTTEQYLELANEVHKWGFSPNAVTAIRTLVAERDALAAVLAEIAQINPYDTSSMGYVVGKAQAALALLHNAEVRGA